MVKQETALTIVTWIDVLDGSANTINMVEIFNKSSASMWAKQAECVEFRHFGVQQDYQLVNMEYSGEIWWMGRRTQV